MMELIKPLRLVAVASILPLAAACALPGGYQSAEYRPPDGARLEVTQTLAAGGGSKRVFIQGGERRPRSNVDRFAPFCRFELNRAKADGQTSSEIRPGKFLIRDTRIWVEARKDRRGRPVMLASAALIPARPLMLASSGAPDAAGTPWPFVYLTRFELHSEKQPHVEDLTCSYEGEAVDRNLKLAQIRETLGDLVRLR